MTSTSAVLLDLWDTLATIGSDTLIAWRRRGAELAGVDPDCLQERWTGTVNARSVGGLGSPRDEVRHLLAACSGHSAGDHVVDELVRMEASGWRSGVRLYEDVLPALDALRRDGRRLAIVSNCSWQTRGVVEAIGLAGEVDVVVLSFEVGLLKPGPAILRLALERLGADPASSALVDDVSANLDAARALGMGTVLMDRSDRAASRAPAHPTVRDLGAALAALR
jgi:putative hydrolase of the HAD superfamily